MKKSAFINLIVGTIGGLLFALGIPYSRSH